MHGDFMWGANGNLFLSRLELSNGLAETGHIHNTCFFLIKEHRWHVSVQILPTHIHSAATLRGLRSLTLSLGSKTLMSSKSKQHSLLQTIQQKGRVLFPPDNVSRIHFLAPRKHKITPLVSSEFRDFFDYRVQVIY